MLEWFKCPDGQLINYKECLTKCRMEERCLTLPTLTIIAQEREWTGHPSTTQLINGTMYEFLKLTQPYAVDPDDRAFSLAGTMHHRKLEDAAKALNLPTEVAMTGEDRDIIDLLECENGIWTITDYKNWGSYHLARALGITEVGRKPDPSGEVYKSSGKWGKAGTPKMVPVFQEMSQQADNHEAELQLNHYRLLAKDKFGINVTKLRVQVTVRDGGLTVAKTRGIERNTRMVTVKLLDDGYVQGYFDSKAKRLLDALETNTAPEPCNEQECWEGARCKRYCEVSLYCPKGMLYQQGG